MRYLPYERFIIKSDLSLEDAITRLTKVVESKVLFGFFTEGKPYQGSIEGTKFSINRIIWYANPDLPIISGEFKPELNGCSIHITMKPNPLIIIFIGIILLILILTYVMLLSQAFLSPQPFLWKALLILLAAILFTYGLNLVFFKMEAGIAKNFLCKLFQSN